MLFLASCWESYSWNPWNALLSFQKQAGSKYSFYYYYCYLDSLLEDQIMESNSVVLMKQRMCNLWDELLRFRGGNFHFQQALFCRPPAGSSLMSVFLQRGLWGWHIHCITFWNESDIAVVSANKIRLLFTQQESDPKWD